MKLSEAILKGCEMVPKQAYHGYVVISSDGSVLSACAIGAAAVAYEGLGQSSGVYCSLGRRLLDRADLIVPGTAHFIVSRNDTGTSREAIAAELAELGL